MIDKLHFFKLILDGIYFDRIFILSLSKYMMKKFVKNDF